MNHDQLHFTVNADPAIKEEHPLLQQCRSILCGFQETEDTGIAIATFLTEQRDIAEIPDSAGEQKAVLDALRNLYISRKQRLQFRMILKTLLSPDCQPVLFLTHPLEWIGGASAFGKQQIRRLLDAGRTVLTLSPLNGMIKVECSFRDFSVTACAQNPGSLLLPELQSRITQIEINDLVSWNLLFRRNTLQEEDFEEMITFIRRIGEASGCGIRYYFHSFFPVCPFGCLFNEKQTYCRPDSDWSACTECVKHKNSMLGINPGEHFSIVRWREMFRGLFSHCTELRFFSASSCAIVRNILPDLPDWDEKVKVEGHLPQRDLTPIHPERGEKIVIVCAGTIDRIKGAALLEALSEYIHVNGLPAEIVVLGSLQATRPLPPNIRMTGKYRQEDMPALLKHFKANIGFMPSLWPETFSFVTQEFMMMDLPTVCFDLGAPAERLGAWERGMVIPEMTVESTWATICRLYEKCYGKS